MMRFMDLDLLRVLEEMALRREEVETLISCSLPPAPPAKQLLLRWRERFDGKLMLWHLLAPPLRVKLLLRSFPLAAAAATTAALAGARIPLTCCCCCLIFISDPRRRASFCCAAAAATAAAAAAAAEDGKLFSDSDAEVKVEELGDMIAWSTLSPLLMALTRCFCPMQGQLTTLVLCLIKNIL